MGQRMGRERKHCPIETPNRTEHPPSLKSGMLDVLSEMIGEFYLNSGTLPSQGLPTMYRFRLELKACEVRIAYPYRVAGSRWKRVIVNRRRERRNMAYVHLQVHLHASRKKQEFGKLLNLDFGYKGNQMDRAKSGP